jgi:hypothetical protein
MFNIDYDSVPAPHMKGAVQRYIENGIHPGGFLGSLICNDLRGTVLRADQINQQLIGPWLHWFRDHAPSSCWGYPEAMDDWPRQLYAMNKGTHYEGTR